LCLGEVAEWLKAAAC